MSYKLGNNCIIRTEDGASIPVDENNIDYKEFLVWQQNGNTPTPMPLPTLSEIKQAKKVEIIDNFEQAMQQITAGYPQDEIASWGKQEAEARAFTASATAPTPLIDALSTARGVAKTELVTRIIAKADLFATVSGQLIGKRQGLEDAVDAATNKTALASIAWA